MSNTKVYVIGENGATWTPFSGQLLELALPTSTVLMYDPTYSPNQEQIDPCDIEFHPRGEKDHIDHLVIALEEVII